MTTSLQNLTENEREKLSPDGPKPACLYGSPKVRKPLVEGLLKYRSIISQIGSPIYKIAKNMFIQPFTSNEFTVKDTFHLSMLEGKDRRLIMANLDVDSPFMNIPQDETITIVANKVFGNKRKVKGISKNEFPRLLLMSSVLLQWSISYTKRRCRNGIPTGAGSG